jgi:cytochrome c oxidase subunit 4
MSSHVVPARAYIAVFAALMVLTAVTTAVAFIDLGAGNNFVALAIATTKAALVLLVFMHLRWSSRLVQVLAASALFFLLALFAFTFADEGTRAPVGGFERAAVEPGATDSR